MPFSPEKFFDFTAFDHRPLFDGRDLVWEALSDLKRYVLTLSLGKIECDIPLGVTLVNPSLISIGKGCVVYPGSYIEGPCVIGCESEVRFGAFIRPYVLCGRGCVLGHGCEVKESILFEGVKLSHFNYVGNSILGNGVNFGAGAVCANQRLDKKEVAVKKVKTGLTKLGAIVGDKSQVGCNCVLNPGTCLLPKSACLPCGGL